MANAEKVIANAAVKDASIGRVQEDAKRLPINEQKP
jgi:hypothetical protein